MSAPLVKVGDLADQVRGVSYAKGDAEQAPMPGYLPVLRAGNITEHGLIFEDLVYVPSARISPKQKVQKNDVVIAASSGSLDVVGKAAAALQDFEGGFGAFCKVLRPNNKVHPGYFAHFFKTSDYRRRISALAEGANINNLRNEHLDDLLVLLPPLPEQHRIAAILDQAEALRTKRRAALAKLDTLAQSIFIEMFGDPRVNPKNWPKRPFDEVCNTRLGRMLDQKRETGAFRRPYLRNANVQWFSFDISDVYEMDFAPEDRQTYLLQDGDLLICEGGQPGRCAIWRNQLSECYFQKALHRGRPKQGVANSEYLARLLWFMVQNGQLGDQVTSATIAHLTGEKLKAMSILLPPFRLQEEFAARLGAVNRIADTLRDSATQLDHLFSSIQNKAFRGDL
jgi:type I restriction enzyme S subunit